MITIEDILYKLRVLGDVIPCIEEGDDIQDIIKYLEDRVDMLEMTEED
jgi:hypothetical protein